MDKPGQADVTVIGAASAPAKPVRRGRLLRGPGAWRAVLAACFGGACLASAGLCAAFHWPLANVPVYYFTIRPAFLWFGALAPFVLAGALALRMRWFLPGLALWLLTFGASEDLIQCVKPFEGKARARFEDARMVYRSFTVEKMADFDVVDAPLRIVTWNIASGVRGGDRVAEQLAGLNPDIAILQEYRWGSDMTMAQAFRLMPGREAHILKVQNGMAILSRFPVVNAPAADGARAPLAAWRHAVWRVQIAPRRVVTCVAIHLSPPAVKTQILRGLSWRGIQEAVGSKRRELDSVRALVDRYAADGPVILAGDFNVPAHYPDLRAVSHGWIDCFDDGGYGWGKTAPAFLPGVRVDMIFVPAGSRVFYAGAESTRHSDHCPVVAEVAINVPRSDGRAFEEPAKAPPVAPPKPAPRPVVAVTTTTAPPPEILHSLTGISAEHLTAHGFTRAPNKESTYTADALPMRTVCEVLGVGFESFHLAAGPNSWEPTYAARVDEWVCHVVPPLRLGPKGRVAAPAKLTEDSLVRVTVFKP